MATEIDQAELLLAVAQLLADTTADGKVGERARKQAEKVSDAVQAHRAASGTANFRRTLVQIAEVLTPIYQSALDVPEGSPIPQEEMKLLVRESLESLGLRPSDNDVAAAAASKAVIRKTGRIRSDTGKQDGAKTAALETAGTLGSSIIATTLERTALYPEQHSLNEGARPKGELRQVSASAVEKWAKEKTDNGEGAVRLFRLAERILTNPDPSADHDSIQRWDDAQIWFDSSSLEDEAAPSSGD